MMKNLISAQAVALLIVCAFSFLSGQTIQTAPHLDERALDALITEPRKWWPEIRHLMRDREKAAIQLEAAKYVLSRSSVWLEEDPRDGETRAAIQMLAGDVAGVAEPELAMRPAWRQIVESQDYRNNLLLALNPSPTPRRALARAALKEPPSKADVSGITKIGPNQFRIALPGNVPATKPAQVPPASIDAVDPVPTRLSLHYLWIVGGVLALAVLAWLIIKKRRRG